MFRLLKSVETDFQAMQRIEEDTSLQEVTTSRGFFGHLAMIPSNLIISFTTYLFALDMDVTQTNAILVGVAMFALIFSIDKVRGNSLAEFLSYFLEKKVIDEAKLPWFSAVVFAFITFLFVAGDIYSGTVGGRSLFDSYVKSKVVNSETYKASEAEAKSGAKQTEIYLSLLSDWKNEKKEAFAACDKSYPISRRPKGNAWCKNMWEEKHPQPNIGAIKTASTVSTETVSKLQQKVIAGANFIIAYLPFIIFGLSFLFTVLGMLPIINDFRNKQKGLTADKISELQNRIEAMNALKKKRLEESTQRQKEAKERQNKLDNELEAATYAKSLKLFENKVKIAQHQIDQIKIFSPENITDTEVVGQSRELPPKKAAFVVNPLVKEEMNQHEKNIKGLNNHDENLKKFDRLITKEEKYQAKKAKKLSLKQRMKPLKKK